MSAKIGIVVPTFNGRRWILECLTSISGTRYPNFCIYVVDNGSEDGTPEKVRTCFPGIRLLKLPRNKGFACACNAGIQLALKEDADFVAVLNQDLWVEETWLQPLIEAVEKCQKFGIVSPAQWDYSGSELDPSFLSSLLEVDPAIESKLKNPAAVPSPIEVEDTVGAALILSRKMIQAVGAFDPLYFAYFEEKDLCRRARMKGFRVGIVPRSRVFHWHSLLHPEQLPKFVKFLAVRNQFIFALKDPTQPLWSNAASCIRVTGREIRHCFRHPGGKWKGIKRAAALAAIGLWVTVLFPSLLYHRSLERRGAPYI